MLMKDALRLPFATVDGSGNARSFHKTESAAHARLKQIASIFSQDNRTNTVSMLQVVATSRLDANGNLAKV